MSIDEIYSELENKIFTFREKSKLARNTAKKARKKGDMKKADKFNAIARVYDMNSDDLASVYCALFDHTSEEYKLSQDIPF